MRKTKPRYIDANAASERMADPANQKWLDKKIPKSSVAWAQHMVSTAPVVRAAPIAYARWEFKEQDNLEISVRCSKCGFGERNTNPETWLQYPGHKFCGACGAKMRNAKEHTEEKRIGGAKKNGK